MENKMANPGRKNALEIYQPWEIDPADHEELRYGNERKIDSPFGVLCYAIQSGKPSLIKSTFITQRGWGALGSAAFFSYNLLFVLREYAKFLGSIGVE